MLYLDTSVLVAALTNEAETEAIQRWLGQQTGDELAISDWVVTELSSADRSHAPSRCVGDI
jgi:hypothetical protein